MCEGDGDGCNVNGNNVILDFVCVLIDVCCVV